MTIGIPFTESHPELAAEWCEDLSGRALRVLSKTSPVQGMWKSPCGHTWKASIRFRAQGGACKVCSGKQVLAGFNDLATTHAELAEQWSSVNDLNATEVSAGDTRAYQWECEEGHVWKTSVYARVRNNLGCGVCSKHVLITGINDLETTHLEIAAWMDDLDVIPSKVTSGSSRKVRWKCDEGHHFTRSINKQVLKRACPVCKGYVVLQGFNDLATQFPDIAAEWHPHRNGDRSPETEFSAAGTPVWWLCGTCGYEWSAALFDRTRSGTGCPRCAGRVPVPGVNDLATRRPDLLVEWDYRKNTVHPHEISEFSHKDVWWKCAVNPAHVWKASPSNRSTRGCGRCFKASQTSRSETDLYEFVRGVTKGDVERHVAGLIPPYEVDILVPDHELALEYNGLYWHSEATSTDRMRHKRKVDSCASKGVRLIQVWEDDWAFRREAVKSLILNALNVQDEARCVARNAVVVDVAPKDAENFLRKTHIQGFKRSTFHRGLLSMDGNVVAVMSVTSKGSGNFTIDRYFATHHVHSGFARLLDDLTKTIREQGGGCVTSISDNSVPTGTLYEECGFSLLEDIPVDYMYLYKGQRHSKFNFRKGRFADDPLLKYEGGLTESGLASLNGLHRIWDSGKKKWEMVVCV